MTQRNLNEITQERILERVKFKYKIQEMQFQEEKRIDNRFKRGRTWDKRGKEEHLLI